MSRGSPIASLADALDRRIGRSAPRPSVWPTGVGPMISHVIVVSFLVLFVTGVFLTLFYRPSVAPVTYTGSSTLYDGATLPHAYASVVRLSSDIPGGLFVKRVHTAASHLFLAAIVLHLLRVMATGQFRRPRLGNHLLGILLLLLGIGFAYTGELLPFTLVASSSLRIAEAVLASIPFLGEPLASIVIGTELPSDRILIGAWALHVVLLPLGFAALTYWHLRLVHRRTPTTHLRPDLDVTRVAVGRPLWPDAVARFALLTTGIVTLLTLSAALIPWADRELAGPFVPAEATNSVHPAWPLFFTTGALRVLPAIDLTFLGMRITNVFVAAAVLPGILIGMLAVYPFLERKLLGDDADHHTVDRILDVPLRAGAVGAFTGIGAVLTLAAGVDVLSFWLATPVESVVVAFRVALVAVPALAAAVMVKAAHTRARAEAEAFRRPAPVRPTSPQQEDSP
ncbi:cytochrome b N-terminal domain-containing protein [Egicoccus sp. AB-alg2]|uniref:cytochrome b N-terminal domain-containing protein n=1 Tax=Egicoccus sp. AB-alg2 TaxID=3242693 RepID=UPI00359E8F56